jgi:CubicO group peptidase (beta-lactamase class C family)
VLDWLAPLQSYLPELRGTWAASATLEQLLSHRSGLLPHRELYRRHRVGLATELTQLLRTAANAVGDEAPTPAEVTRAVYSDLGYLLLGAAIERRVGKSLDCWLAEMLPTMTETNLGSVRQWLSHDPSFRLRCAPTEIVPWRGGLVWGRVHDENAWTLSGHGLSGHAGLFGTAVGVVRFGAGVVDAAAGRPSCVSERATHVTTRRREGGSLCAGFDRKSEVGSTAGSSAGADAFGHLGFTGTSLWCDPSRSIVVALLTNRVCPTRDNVVLRAMRASLHDSLFRWAEAEASAWSA